MVDFESNGLRRTISLKILHLSENGMIDIGFWSSTTRLNINSIGLQQINKIQKHLQVVTREVISLSKKKYITILEMTI